MEGDLIESIAARIRFATGCSYSTSVEAAAISVNLLQPGHDESKARIAALEALLGEAPHDPNCDSLACAVCPFLESAHGHGAIRVGHEFVPRLCNCFKSRI